MNQIQIDDRVEDNINQNKPQHVVKIIRSLQKAHGIKPDKNSAIQNILSIQPHRRGLRKIALEKKKKEDVQKVLSNQINEQEPYTSIPHPKIIKEPSISSRVSTSQGNEQKASTSISHGRFNPKPSILSKIYSVKETSNPPKKIMDRAKLRSSKNTINLHSIPAIGLYGSHRKVGYASFLRPRDLCQLCCCSHAMKKNLEMDELWKDFCLNYPNQQNLKPTKDENWKSFYRRCINKALSSRINSINKKLQRMRISNLEQSHRQAVVYLKPTFELFLNNTRCQFINDKKPASEKWINATNQVSSVSSDENGIRYFSSSITFKCNLNFFSDPNKNLTLKDIKQVHLRINSNVLKRSKELFHSINLMENVSKVGATQDGTDLAVYQCKLGQSENSSVVFGVWEKDSTIQFIYFNIHYFDISEIFLKEWLDKQVIMNDVDSQYGLNSYRGEFTLRTFGQKCWEGYFIDMDFPSISSKDQSTTINLLSTSSCSTDPSRLLINPPELLYQSDSLSGNIPNVIILDFILWDCNDRPIWAISQTVKVIKDTEEQKRLAKESKVYFEYRNASKSELSSVEYSESNVGSVEITIDKILLPGVNTRGTFSELINDDNKDESPKQGYVLRSLDLTLKKSFINQKFGTNY